MGKTKENYIPKLEYELEEQKQGYKLIAGMDEVGRGPLAGPVCVCCVIMPLDDIIEGIDDSKKISEKKRVKLAEIIKEKAIAYSIEMIDEKVIDDINILNATKLCMKNAINNLKIKPDIVLVDAIDKLDVDVKIRGIVKGDFKSYSIGAASILAKVTRDNYMIELAKKYPCYDFAKNKGYGTKMHIEALKKFGPCECHRLTYLKFLNN